MISKITLLFVVIFSLNAIQAQNVEEVFNSAVAEYEKGNIVEAIGYIDQCLEIDSNLAGVWYNRGLFNSKLEKYKEAIADFDKAIALVPTYSKALNMRGNCNQDIEEYDAAIVDYQKAIELDENNLDAMWNLAETYLKKEDNFMACTYFKKAADLGDEQSEERLKYYQQNSLVHDLALVVSKVSNDKSYGYTSENPIMVGSNIYTGPQSERVYLDQLRDLNGNKIEYVRTKNCCPYKSENGLMGTALLDVYEIKFTSNNEMKETKTLYISMYDHETLMAPTGFSFSE